MSVVVRFVRCENCRTWNGLGAEARQLAKPIACAKVGCPGVIELPQGRAFEAAPEKAPALGDQSAQALEIWLRDVSVTLATQNVARAERLARACHAACEASLQQHNLAVGVLQIRAENLRLRFPEIALLLDLPTSLFLGKRVAGTVPVLGAADRLCQCLSLLRSDALLLHGAAVDLDPAIDEAQRTFSAGELFVLMFALAAASVVAKSGDAATLVLVDELRGYLHKRLGPRCDGSRAASVLLAYAPEWMAETEVSTLLVSHLKQCIDDLHISRLLSALLALAAEGRFELESAFDLIQENSKSLDDRGRTRLVESLCAQAVESTGGNTVRWAILRVVLRLAATMAQSKYHSKVMESLESLLKFFLEQYDDLPEAWFSDLDATTMAGAFVPRQPLHRQDITLSLSALSCYFSLLGNNAAQHLHPETLATIASHTVQSLESTTADEQAKNQAKGLINKLALRSFNAELFELIHDAADGQSAELRALLGRIAQARSRRPARNTQQLLDEPIPQLMAPGWMSSIYLYTAQYQPDLLNGVGLSESELELLQSLGMELRLRPHRQHEWGTLGKLSQFARMRATAISPPAGATLSFWQAFAKRAWLVESFALLQHAERAGEGNPGFVVDVSRSRLVDRGLQYRGDPDRTPSGIELEAEWLHHGEPPLDPYPKVPAPLRGTICGEVSWHFGQDTLDEVDTLLHEFRAGFGPHLEHTPAYQLLAALRRLVIDGAHLRMNETSRFWRLLRRSVWEEPREQRDGVIVDSRCAAPTLMELALGSLARIIGPEEWLGPHTTELGELLALLRRDPGVGCDWHGDLYPEFRWAREPGVSLVTLARMAELIRCTPNQPAMSFDFAKYGQAERDLLSAVRGAVVHCASGIDKKEPYCSYLYEEFCCTLREVHENMRLFEPTEGDRQIFFPQRLLRLFAASDRHNLIAHILKNPRCQPLTGGATTLITHGRVTRYCVWVFGSRLWKNAEGVVVEVEPQKLLSHPSVTRHKIARLWLKLFVMTKQGDQIQVFDALTEQQIPIDSEHLPNDLRSQAPARFVHAPDTVIYAFSFAFHDTTLESVLYKPLMRRAGT